MTNEDVFRLSKNPVLETLFTCADLPTMATFALTLHWIYRCPRLYLVEMCDGRALGGGLRFPGMKKVLQSLVMIPNARCVRCTLYPKQDKQWFWSFRIRDHDAVIQHFQEHIPEEICTCEPIPKQVLGIMRFPLPSAQPDEHFEQQLGDLWSRLLPYQRECVKFFVRRQGRGLVGDQMGCGKTLEALAIATYYRQDWPVLVIAPSSVKHTWVNEMLKHGILQDKKEVKIIQGWKDEFEADVQIFVMSYALLNSTKFRPKLLDASKAKKFGVLIMDESHKIKSQKAKRTRVALDLAKRCRRVLLLSGTPMCRPVELYSQFRAVNPRLFPIFFPFRNRGKKGVFYYASRYCEPSRIWAVGGREVWTFKGCNRLHELHAIVRYRVLLRRTKEQVLSQLPEKLRERVVIHHVSRTQTHQMEVLMNRVQEIREQRGNLWADVEFMKYVRELGQLKTPYVVTYLKEVVLEELENQPDLKILVFAHHHYILDAISACFPPDIQMRIDGRTSMKQREGLIRTFQDPESSVRVAVLGLEATGVGLTLTAAQLVIFAELVFSPQSHLQAEDRTHRIGQTRAVLVRYLVASGTLDDLLWGMICKKVRQSSATLEGRTRYLKSKLTHHEVEVEDESTH